VTLGQIKDCSAAMTKCEKVAQQCRNEDSQCRTSEMDCDWRAKKAVTPIKNQRSCMSCWAFSAVASLEGQYGIKNGYAMNLSDQMALDCNKINPNCGIGGWYYDAWDYLKLSGGIAASTAYPYSDPPRKGTCRTNNPAYARVAGYMRLPTDERLLAGFVSNVGPISIALNQNGMQQLGPGVSHPANCNYEPDHAVNIIGFGTDRKTGEQFWLIKNQWGDRIGEKGFHRYRRNVRACQLNVAAYAVLTA